MLQSGRGLDNQGMGHRIVAGDSGDGPNSSQAQGLNDDALHQAIPQDDKSPAVNSQRGSGNGCRSLPLSLSSKVDSAGVLQQLIYLSCGTIFIPVP